MEPAVGIIAGNGIYPATFVEAARAHGVARLVAAAFRNETEPTLEEQVDALAWFRVGQLGKMIRFFQQHGVDRAVMVGQIAPKNLFDLRPDTRVVRILARLKEKNAESIFGAIGDELASEGIELLPATTYLDDHLADLGVVYGKDPKRKRLDDIAYGMKIAKETSRLDIGQTVVVKNGTVLAVEAFEGTNEAIKRGGAHGKGKATVVKVSKPNQDFRFDVPVVGPETIRTAGQSGVDLVVCEAGATLLLGKDEIEKACQEERVVLYGAAP